MSFRMVTAALVLSTSVAAADDNDDISLVPSCAEIDTSRDTLSAPEQAVALTQLTRMLEEADLFVVTEGCVDHYRLSHEHDGDDRIVRLEGPGGARRARNPDADELPATYARLIRAAARPVVQEAPPPPEPDTNTTSSAVPTNDGSDFDAVPPDGDAVVTPERTWFVGLGPSNAGLALTVGYRHLFESTALDLRGYMGDGSELGMAGIGARLLRYNHPTQVTSAYGGGGVGVSTQETSRYMEGSNGGADLEGVVGIAFSRASAWPMYVQADVTLPLYEVGGDYHPTLMLSLGLGH